MGRKYLMLACLAAATVSIACTRNDIVIADFESGTCGGWIIEGDAFGAAPSKGAVGVQNTVTGYGGSYLINSFGSGGDEPTGTLTSQPFTINRHYLNFLLGGGTGCRVELLVDGAPVREAHPLTDSEELVMRTWDVRDIKGSRARLRIIDESTGGWGHILADDFTLSDRHRSDIVAGHTMTIEVDKDCLLIPVEDAAPLVKVYLVLNGGVIEPGMEIRLAVGNVDYYVPLDVSAHKGGRIGLKFAYVIRNGLACSKISQTDGHDFNYGEQYRPNYHFSPHTGWMNDPNGMVWHDGEYHLFFQHNPYGSTWANMTWGHAVSKDLRRWEYLPDAIVPDTLGSIFSGSAVIDKDNTAGFGHNAMVAVYTSEGKSQTQCLAYSLDNDRTFTKYGSNPVLSSTEHCDFRDPKVFRHEPSGKWIMSLATGQVISFYSSPDLKQWTLESDFGEGIGAHGGVWECPDLFELEHNGSRKWVLLVSINPGGPNGGSATQYFIGSFDGKTFKADPLPYPLWLDHGRDNYAGVTWNGAPDGRRIFIGWMNNWDYAGSVPTVNFRSAMTVPRELSLAHNGSHPVVCSRPVDEFFKTRSKSSSLPEAATRNPIKYDLGQNGAGYEIEMEVIPGMSGFFSLKLCNSAGEGILYEFDTTTGKITSDRSDSGLVSFNGSFADRPIHAPIAKKPKYTLRMLVDNSSVELFVDGGQTAITNLVFPSRPYSLLELSGDGRNDVRFKNILIHTLK